MTTHSSILAWEIPWTEEPGGYSPWSLRIQYNLATKHMCTTVYKFLYFPLSSFISYFYLLKSPVKKILLFLVFK